MTRANYLAENKERIASVRAAYRDENKENIKAYNRLYYAKDREKAIAKALVWQSVHPERAKKSKREDAIRHAEQRRPAKLECHRRNNATQYAKQQKKAWKKSNPDIVAAGDARRRASKKNATVAWANDLLIQEIYELAQSRSLATGIPHEVDHFYPLQSDVVCGLHVEHNLQVITATANHSKGNRVADHG